MCLFITFDPNFFTHPFTILPETYGPVPTVSGTFKTLFSHNTLLTCHPLWSITPLWTSLPLRPLLVDLLVSPKVLCFLSELSKRPDSLSSLYSPSLFSERVYWCQRGFYKTLTLPVHQVDPTRYHLPRPSLLLLLRTMSHSLSLRRSDPGLRWIKTLV